MQLHRRPADNSKELLRDIIRLVDAGDITGVALVGIAPGPGRHFSAFSTAAMQSPERAAWALQRAILDLHEQAK